MPPYADLPPEALLNHIFADAGWSSPGERDAAGVLTFKHSRWPIAIIVRHFLQQDGSEDMLTFAFSDPSFNAAFAEHGGWADYGQHLGGGLFLLRNIRLGHFLKQSFEYEYGRIQKAPPAALPFVFRHPYQR
jgi:hypothetical protein